ncbi:MAG: hypothetical protein A2X94_07415 [Bdellovibrionales bacterium GWB1_55_8]|nr:MAG: hypothetical protein A2X94_07415 [Bdellovibrionales bacterium GWB1_55_8]
MIGVVKMFASLSQSQPAIDIGLDTPFELEYDDRTMIKSALQLILIGTFFCGNALGFSGKAASSSSAERAWVMIPDGSKQCGFESGIEIKSSEVILKKAGIRVEKTQKSTDGMMHIQMCGAPTGAVHGFLIDKSQVAEAEKLGFTPAPDGFPFQ